MERIVKESRIDLGELFSYVHLVAKRGGVIRSPAEKRRFFSRSILRETPKIEKPSPTLSMYNIQKRSVAKHAKCPSFSCAKWKIDDLLTGPLNCLEVERGPLAKIRESNEQLVLKEMLRRNERILGGVRKEEKRLRGRAVQTEASEEGR